MKQRIFITLALTLLCASVSTFAYTQYVQPDGKKVNGGICSAINKEQLSALAQGELAALKILDTPRPMPDLEFLHETTPVKLSDFKGKAVVLNIWASWCVPCRAEMPALSMLQHQFSPQKAEVVAVSLDIGGLDKPKKFLTQVKADNLKLYVEPSGKILQDLKAIGRGTGLPTTLLIDSKGCEHGFLLGAADWGGEHGKKIVEILSGK